MFLCRFYIHVIALLAAMLGLARGNLRRLTEVSIAMETFPCCVRVHFIINKDFNNLIMPATATQPAAASALEGPVAFGLSGDQRWALASAAAAVAAALVVASGERCAPAHLSACAADEHERLVGMKTLYCLGAGGAQTCLPA